MAERRVTHTGKNIDGDITALCNPAGTWGPRSKNDAIRDIESKLHNYYVQWPERRTEIHVVNGRMGKYLRTDRDATTRNNLDDLPDC
jgi:hypothetical protein